MNKHAVAIMWQSDNELLIEFIEADSIAGASLEHSKACFKTEVDLLEALDTEKELHELELEELQELYFDVNAAIDVKFMSGV